MKPALTVTLRILISTIGWMVLISVLWVLLFKFFEPPVSSIMVRQARELGAIDHRPVPFGQVSKHVPLAMIGAEDQAFMVHRGFDLQAIEKAFDRNKKKGKIRGGSTISQQTAKNAFLWPHRNWLRKGAEAWFTILIEAFWSKRRIMEVYMNVAETGKGMFGVQAAATTCFKKDASKLSAAQAAMIAASLPSPRKSNACRPGQYLQRRQQWIQRQMRNIGEVKFD